MSRRSLSMQLVMDSSSDDDDDDFLLSVTHVAMNADESDDETRHRGCILGHRVLRRDRQGIIGYIKIIFQMIQHTDIVILDEGM